MDKRNFMQLMNRTFCNIFQKLSFIQWNKTYLLIHIHTHTNIHVNKLVDNSCCFLGKQI